MDGIWFCVVIEFSGRERLSDNGSSDDTQGGATIQAMEEEMKSQKIPKTDSIEELARFWDAHDITDFEEELEEVTEAVFARRGCQVTIRLDERESEAVRPDRIC